MKNYTNTKVVSRNFIMDFVASFQNLVGRNLTSYEKMVQKGIKQIEDDLIKDKIKFIWYRYQITQLSSGSMSITIYGEIK